MPSARALNLEETRVADPVLYHLVMVLASYDRVLNGACVPVRESGPEIPAESLARFRRSFNDRRNYPV